MRRTLSNIFGSMRDGWGLAKPYFSSEERWPAIGLLVTIVVLNLFLTFLNVEFTYWQRDFYNALQNKQFGQFIKLIFFAEVTNGFPFFILGYVGYAGTFIIVSTYALYLNQMLQIKWRQWLTKDFAARWLADHAYYNISLGRAGTVDNPDQRIADDLSNFTSGTLSLGLDLISNIVTLLSFITVLYAISGSITLLGITIPGYMLWFAIIYSVLGTWITHMIGRKLIPLNFNQQRVEADFRYSLIRVRDNPEAIALSGGEKDELGTLSERFSHVRGNFWAIMKRTRLLGFFTNGYSTFSVIAPIAAASPRYFAGLIQLGDLIQIGTVFGQVQGPMSWIVSQYSALVGLRATIERLTGFKEAVTAARVASAQGPQLRESGEALVLENLTLSLPDGRKLIDHANLTLPPGEPILLTGPSGIGKSTLFRAIAGIWPFGDGVVSRPAGAVLFLPQKPYFPLGSLRRAITYPGDESAFSEDALHQALTLAGLDMLIPRLDEVEPWGQILSGGEQQRLSMVRALLTKPAWLFLDEATSSLDKPAAEALFATLRAHLPETTVVAISHNDAEADAPRHVAISAGALAEV